VFTPDHSRQVPAAELVNTSPSGHIEKIKRKITQSLRQSIFKPLGSLNLPKKLPESPDASSDNNASPFKSMLANKIKKKFTVK
jgi:hypothetical protein